MPTITFLVPVGIEKDNGEFHAFCPPLKGLHTRGKTIEEVKENVENAIMAYIHSLIKHGDPIPLLYIKEKKSHKRYMIEYTENLIEVTM